MRPAGSGPLQSQTVTAPLHHHRTTVTSPLHRRYITVTSTLRRRYAGESRWQWTVPELRVDDAIVRGPLPLMTLWRRQLWEGTPHGFDEALPKVSGGCNDRCNGRCNGRCNRHCVCRWQRTALTRRCPK